MNGYKIVYSEPDGTIKEKFFGEPITNISIPKSCYKDIVKQIFSLTYPNYKFIYIERCKLEE